MRSVRGSKGKGTTLVEERGLTDIIDLAPRRMSHLATFTKIELVIRFMPGSGGVGAVVHSFLHAAHTHEQIVHIVEEKWRLSDELSKKYKKMNKLYRNLDAFYYVSNKNPAELDMYEEMKPRMTGSLESRLQSASDSRMKADLIAEDNAFKELEVRCERLIALRAELSKMKQIRDTCQLESVTALEDLNYSKSQEILAANKVSQDHMLAIQRKISLHELYANIHIGYILIRINDQEVEHLPFQQIMEVIKFSSSPHNAEFQRYDSIYDPAKGRWTHLSEQRAKKMYIADPIIKCREFFAMVRAGDIRAVQRELAEGTDPNTVDDTLTSALHVAAVSNHPEIVKELVDAGARLESRDANMSTALLSSVKRGLLSMCQLLLDLGAVKMVSDRTFRSSSYFAAKSGCIELVRLFVDRSNCNAADNLWCSTPMHIGAERGDERLISYLLQLDASIYALDKGRTPEQVALEAKQIKLYELLRDTRFAYPGQLVWSRSSSSDASGGFVGDAAPAAGDSSIEARVWIGEHEALRSPSWLADVDISTIICVLHGSEEEDLGENLLVQDDLDISFISLNCDDDDSSSSSWDSLCRVLPAFLSSFTEALERGGNVLICDPTGFSSSVALLSIFLLLKFQTRIETTEELCVKARPCVYLSLSHRRGLRAAQARLDQLQMKRMNSKLRTSSVVSLAF